MIKIKFVKKGECRNNDVGDYQYDKKGNLIIKVADTGNDIYNIAMAIHELWESSLLKKRGIPEEAVNEFDKKCNEENKHDMAYGDRPECIYKKEHRSAENIERLFIQECGEDWFEYDDFVNNL